LYKGGGTIFGPKPHSYDFKLNRKVKDLAKISALSHKAKDNAIIVVEEITMATPKTKQLVDVMGNLKVSDKKALIVLPEYNDNLYLSTRNVPNVASTLLADINTYDIMNADVLVITENTAKIFAEDEAAAVA
jgi:large subunit ribosomal protein L4